MWKSVWLDGNGTQLLGSVQNNERKLDVELVLDEAAAKSPVLAGGVIYNTRSIIHLTNEAWR